MAGSVLREPLSPDPAEACPVLGGPVAEAAAGGEAGFPCLHAGGEGTLWGFLPRLGVRGRDSSLEFVSLGLGGVVLAFG